MKWFSVLIMVVAMTAALVADERPFALGVDPTPLGYSESLLPRGGEGGRRPDEGVARGRTLDHEQASVTRSPPLPDPLPRGGREGTEQEIRRVQWVMFTAEWCPACRAARADFEPWLKRSGWRIDDSAEAHIRLIDGDAHPDLVAAMRIEMYPTFLLFRDGVELYRQQGYPGREELVRRHVEAAKATSQLTGAIHTGTLTGQRENIRALIAAMRPLLGDGGTLTMQLDRHGEKTAEIPLGARMSLAVGNPLVMRYTLHDDVLTCRFAEPLPRGRFTFGVPIEQPVAAVSLSVSEVALELPRAPDVKWRVAP